MKFLIGLSNDFQKILSPYCVFYTINQSRPLLEQWQICLQTGKNDTCQNKILVQVRWVG